MMRALAVGLLVAASAAPVFAQTGPSFDCSKSPNSIERVICGDPELAAADLKVAEAYKALLDGLDEREREHAQKDQTRWVANRNRACNSGAMEPAVCLKNRYKVRLEFLQTAADGRYPFVSEQAVEKRGKVKAVKYFIDASYPQFDGSWADFRETNQNFEGNTKEAVADATPDADADATREQTWNYEQSFEIFRPGRQALSVVTRYYGFTGGANGTGGVIGSLVDLRTGLLLAPSEVFASGDGWRGTLREIVVAELKRQFVERPGFVEELEPAKMDKKLRETRHYLWKADGLHVVFNQYDVGPRVMGPYVVTIPYEKLRPLLRPDAPVGNQ
jgi:uncharacterized protein